MRFLSLVFVNLRRHRLRALIGVAGIGFGVAAAVYWRGMRGSAFGRAPR